MFHSVAGVPAPAWICAGARRIVAILGPPSWPSRKNGLPPGFPFFVSIQRLRPGTRVWIMVTRSPEPTTGVLSTPRGYFWWLAFMAENSSTVVLRPWDMSSRATVTPAVDHRQGVFSVSSTVSCQLCLRERAPRDGFTPVPNHVPLCTIFAYKDVHRANLCVLLSSTVSGDHRALADGKRLS